MSRRKRGTREESVYNLCEKPKEFVKKAPRHRSQHHGKKKTSWSTFDNKKKNTGVMGRHVKDTVNPEFFRMKRTGHKDLPLPKKKFNRSLVKSRKGRVPKRTEKPIMGLKSKKNYVRTNIIKNISSRPQQKVMGFNYLQKEDFGKVPEYLHGIKEEIDEEYQFAKTLAKRHREQASTQAEVLPKEEQQMILDKLNEKRRTLLAVHQKLCFTIPSSKGKNNTVTLDHTNHMVRKKETIEDQLDQIEKDIELLSKGNVFVYD